MEKRGTPRPNQRATSFGAVASRYAALRPTWPAATAAWLTGLPAGTAGRVLDLGAGTGALTRTLVAAGHEVLAVDADERMLAVLAGQVPGAAVRPGRAEAIPEHDAARDAVTVAQAWHWFDPATTGPEVARVLRPGGTLGIAWHVRDESVPWVAELARVAGRPEDSSARRRGDVPPVPGPFEPGESALFDYSLTTTPAGLRDLADTWSYVRLAQDRERRLAAILAVAAAAAQDDGSLAVPHVTRCYRFRRG